MKKIATLASFALLVMLALPTVLVAQPGTLDATFNPGTGANNLIWSVVYQPDGRVLIGGEFTSYNGTARNYIARLNADGSLDGSFNPGTGANGQIISVVYQPDGKVLIIGFFTAYNGTARNRIARLNFDGSLDVSFDPGTGANNVIGPVVYQPDGKVLIGGDFTTCNGTARNRVARLNADGSLDGSFNPGGGANSDISSIAYQPDGKVLIGGNFTAYNGTARNRIARLNADGSLDVGFNPGTGANDRIRSVAYQPDGKVLIGGDFTTFNGTARNRIARLNADGSLDGSFNPGTGANTQIRSVAYQPDGKVLIGGNFTTYNGTARNNIARLNADGSLNGSFNPGAGASNTIFSVALQPDGQVLIGGFFTSYNGTARNYIARVNGDPQPPTVTSFTPTSGATGTTVTITGTNFTGASAVSFGGTAAASFNVVSATQITAVVGSGASGSVSVTTPGGTATEIGFIYCTDPPPTIVANGPTTFSLCNNGSLGLSTVGGAGNMLMFGGNGVLISSLNTSPGSYATLTTSAWARRTGGISTWQAIVSNDDSGFDRAIMIFTDGNYHIFAGRDINTGIPSVQNQWEFITVTWSSSAVTMFRNGVQVYTTSGESGSSSSVGTYIGMASVGYPFYGSIDQVSFWNTARTPAQITSEMNTYLAGNEAGLVGYYKFDESSGTTTADATANARTGSFSGSPSRSSSTAPSGFASYLWSPGGATTNSISVNTAGTTSYSVQVTTAAGCSNTASSISVTGQLCAPTITTFPNLNKTLYEASFLLSDPTSNSTGSFSYASSNLAVATISGNTVTIVGVGTAVITATQAASAPYETGSITATLTVTSVETVTRFGERTLNKQTYPNKNGALGGQQGVNRTGKEVVTKN
jgi:uncharacterized delta-60 repeat protein